MQTFYTFLPVIILVVIFLASAIRVLNEYQRGVIFRLGRVLNVKGPGLIILIPVIDKMVKVSLRIITLDVPSQDVITKDNVSVKINAVIYFRVVEPNSAILSVEDYMFATSQLAQTTLRSVCGSVELDEILAHRAKINQQIQDILDEHTDAWGIKVTNVEVKYIDLPQEMQMAMARQAQAERDRRSKVINAEGEYQAASRLTDAAHIMNKYPAALQLRYLQTMREMTYESKATTIIPIPLEAFKAFAGPQDDEQPPPAPDAQDEESLQEQVEPRPTSPTPEQE
jgi:regulator of protease activity HflC (stomatin/prohibitin superfamily)